MATQIQHRRGTTSGHSSFTGAAGEVTVDTDKNVLVVHDGATASGFSQVGANSAQALSSSANAMTISGHTITLARGDSTTDTVTVPDTNTTYSVGDGGLTQVNFTTADNTKLDGIEALADVTDVTNVTAAGALMDSEVTNLAQVKAFDTTDYATAAQGTTANAALPKAGGTMTGTTVLKGITETQVTKSASFTPAFADGTVYSCTGTMTITMPTATAGKSFTIVHATATSITWAGTIKWNGGSAPTADSGIDIYVFMSDGTNWYANQAGTGYA